MTRTWAGMQSSASATAVRKFAHVAPSGAREPFTDADNALIAEVTTQLTARFLPHPNVIKKRIESTSCVKFSMASQYSSSGSSVPTGLVEGMRDALKEGVALGRLKADGNKYALADGAWTKESTEENGSSARTALCLDASSSSSSSSTVNLILILFSFVWNLVSFMSEFGCNISSFS